MHEGISAWRSSSSAAFQSADFINVRPFSCSAIPITRALRSWGGSSTTSPCGGR